MDNKKWTKAYKGFNADMTCNPDGNTFQYAEGGSYEEESCDLCSRGFHACERPLDTFNHYSPATSVYHEVELDGVSEQREDDTKICGKKIKIGCKLSVANIVKAQFEYVSSHCTNENNAEPGKPATAGYRGAATAGYRGAATAGDSGAATAGYRGAATAGDSGAATAGDSGAATAGDSGAATAGYRGAATSRGSVIVGDNGVGTVRGNGVRIKGGLGALLVAAEEADDNYNIVTWAAVVVDGDKIKPNTWYGVKDGEFEEVDQDVR